jgi:predicted Ser/Thr protein kinase
MNDIYIDYKSLEFDRYLDVGSYSRVYLLQNKKQAIKILSDDYSEEDIKNIIEKVKLLSDLKELSKVCARPELLAFDRQKLKGIVMEYFSGRTLGTLLSMTDKVAALNIIKNILFQFKKHGIRYYDLHYGNILYKRNGDNLIIKFVDMDNISIGNFEIDSHGYRLDDYLALGGKVNFNAEIFLFNWLTYVLLTDNMWDLSSNANNLVRDLKKKDLYDNKIYKFCYSLFNKRADQIGDHEFLIDRVNDLSKIKHQK